MGMKQLGLERHGCAACWATFTVCHPFCPSSGQTLTLPSVCGGRAQLVISFH